MSQIKIIKKSGNLLDLEIDPKLFDDFDSDVCRVQINYADSDSNDFYCEHDDCENPDAPGFPSVSFLDWSPAQSVPSYCVTHMPQPLVDFVKANWPS